eukprot:TRINITY_DN29282_c0_g1_i1.p1 TRINITY_DN29282_c0_g1~~TRINITY_DN29282_c0_g1_i1.p1  ORF type:complete len:164 (-),score=29.26 TRINITY_DN29282_c0_g1_i1:260-751(-)
MSSYRRVGVAIDFSDCSRNALKWAVDNLVRHGDYLIVVTVRGKMDEDGFAQLWEDSGSPLIPLGEFKEPSNQKKYGVHADPNTIDLLDLAAKEKQAEVVVKILYGDPREKLMDAVENTPLDCLVLGNRGLGKIKRAIMGSVSNYLVNNATCPVTVVKSRDAGH